MAFGLVASAVVTAAAAPARDYIIDVWGTDLNPAAVDFAKEGLYPVRRMIGVSEERLLRFDGCASSPSIPTTPRRWRMPAPNTCSSTSRRCGPTPTTAR